jgi:hypothetical protein
MHPEFNPRKNTVVFNQAKYLKQWLLFGALVSLFFLFRGNIIGMESGLLICLFFFGLYLASKRVFKFVTLLWLKIGEIIGRIMQPIIMGLVFYIFFVPFGFVYRIFTKKSKGFQAINKTYGLTSFNQQF